MLPGESGNSWILPTFARIGGAETRPLKVSKASRSRPSEQRAGRMFIRGFLSYAFSEKGKLHLSDGRLPLLSIADTLATTE
jgi:hypothetical protein